MNDSTENSISTESSETSEKDKEVESDHLSFKEIVRTVVISSIMAFILVNYIIVNAIIPSSSMEPTINIGDRVIGDRIIYKVTGIERGDIVIFHPPIEDKKNVYYIKRVIGLPGETIEGRNGYVYINGKKLEETYVADLLNNDFGPYTIPEDNYFMMGDNRSNSFDSRFWDDKFVSSESIIGRAVFKYTGGFEVYKTPDYYNK